MSDDYSKWTDEQLAEEEARLSGIIHQIDEEISALRALMRSTDIQVNPIRNEIENRKFFKARRDPRTQRAGL